MKHLERTTRNAFFAVLYVIFSFTLAQAQSEQWQTLYSGNAKSSVYVIGNVYDVRSGAVKPGSFVQQLPPDILLSTGLGTLTAPEGAGEMFTVAGKSYIKWADSAKGYRTESSAALLKTPFSFGLQIGSKPKEILHFVSSQGVSVDNLFRDISPRYGRVFAVFGIVRFASLASHALKRAPMYGEPIAVPENRGKYYHPDASFTDQTALLFGIVVNPDRPQPVGYADSLEQRIIYLSGAERSASTLRNHAHVLTVSDKYKWSFPTTPDKLLREAQSCKVEDVGHLLVESTVWDCVMMVYDVEALTPYTPKYGAYWFHKASQFEESAKRTKGNPIVMLGNSITDGFLMNEYLPEYKIVNRGISGDVTSGLLDRLSSVVALKPSMLFIMIGTNDVARGYSDSLILSYYETLLQEMKNGSPKTKIVVESVLPTRNWANRPNGRIDTLNQKLKEMAKEHGLKYLDLHPIFKDKDGNLAEEFSVDGLHLNGAAYNIWARELKRLISGTKR